VARGRLGRCKVRSIVIAKAELERRKFLREKQIWTDKVQNKASLIIQMAYRKYRLKCNILQRLDEKYKRDQVEDEMAVNLEKVRLQKAIHKLTVEKWFADRKLEYESTRFREESNISLQLRIVKMKIDQSKQARLLREKEKEENEKEMEENRWREWSDEWDRLTETRAAERYQKVSYVIQTVLTVNHSTV